MATYRRPNGVRRDSAPAPPVPIVSWPLPPTSTPHVLPPPPPPPEPTSVRPPPSRKRDDRPSTSGGHRPPPPKRPFHRGTATAPPRVQGNGSGSLPKELVDAGNARAWKELTDLITRPTSAGKPVIVCGPTGCGKTYGVEKVLESIGVRACTVDPGDTVGTVRERLKSASVVHLGGRRALVFDGLDGYHPDAVAELAAAGNAAVGGVRGRRPIVIGVCVDAFSLHLQSLRNWPRVSLRAPDEESTLRALEASNPGRSSVTLRAVAARGRGDLRAAVKALSDGPSAARDVQRVIFDDARRLILGQSTPSEWERAAGFGGGGGARAVGTTPSMLLFHNLTQVADTIEQAADMVESFSLADQGCSEASETALSMVSHTFHKRLGISHSRIPLRLPKNAPPPTIRFTDAAW